MLNIIGITLLKTLMFQIHNLGQHQTKVFDFINCIYNNMDKNFYRATAMLSAVYAVVVCLCVCLSVTLRYCIKTAKPRITQRKQRHTIAP